VETELGNEAGGTAGVNFQSVLCREGISTREIKNIDKGLYTAERSVTMAVKFKRKRCSLGSTCVVAGAVRARAGAENVAVRANMPFVRCDRRTVSGEARDVRSSNDCRRLDVHLLVVLLLALAQP